jgi:predicted nucleic acid-binding protein
MATVKAVFDSNILIDYLNGERKAVTEISRYQKRLISRITWMEVLIGAQTEVAKDAAFSCFQLFNVAEVTEEVALRAIEIRSQHRLKLPDAIILGTARTYRCLLVTRNTVDFSAKKFADVREPYRLSRGKQN